GASSTSTYATGADTRPCARTTHPAPSAANEATIARLPRVFLRAISNLLLAVPGANPGPAGSRRHYARFRRSVKRRPVKATPHSPCRCAVPLRVLDGIFPTRVVYDGCMVRGIVLAR